jgi:hypothetical protein
MSSDLVKRLRDGNTLDIGEAADLIEALEGEVAKLKEQVRFASETDPAMRAEAAEARAERLRVALEFYKDEWDRSIEGCAYATEDLLNDKGEVARKALEDDKQ